MIIFKPKDHEEACSACLPIQDAVPGILVSHFDQRDMHVHAIAQSTCTNGRLHANMFIRNLQRPAMHALPGSLESCEALASKDRSSSLFFGDLASIRSILHACIQEKSDVPLEFIARSYEWLEIGADRAGLINYDRSRAVALTTTTMSRTSGRCLARRQPSASTIAMPLRVLSDFYFSIASSIVAWVQRKGLPSWISG